MFAIIVVAASEAQNIITVARNNIFSPIEGQNLVLELTKTTNPLDTSTTSTSYTSDDTSAVSSIENVEKASLISQLPLQNVMTSDLFSDKEVTISSIAGLDSEYASLYTNQGFSYTEGQAIPIILNANDFYETTEDWQGKTELTVAMGPNRDTSTSTDQNPVRTSAITYNRDELIGKTITVNIGGLADLTSYTATPSSTGLVYKQKTDDELKAEENSRKDAISKYWDYEKIKTPLTYTFVVVGVSQGTDKTTAYVPTAFASKLMKDYIQNEVSARNGTAIPSEDQNSVYAGLTYDGVSLVNDSTSQLFAGLRRQVLGQVQNQFNSVNEQIAQQNRNIARANQQMQQQSGDVRGLPPGASINFQKIGSIGSLNAGSISVTFPGSSSSYTIPGLVYQKDRTAGNITGEYKSFDMTQDIPLSSNKMVVKVSSVSVRDSVVSALNEKGYTYQDFSQYKQFAQLENYLTMALNVAGVIFMVVTALFILINMAKFVSESRKEIGIFRAIGASKNTIRILFVLQALGYILIATILGSLLGLGIIYGLSSLMASGVQQFIYTTLQQSITLTNTVVTGDFVGINFPLIGIYFGTMALITLIVSLIPAEQAAKVSPVEAIRNS